MTTDALLRLIAFNGYAAWHNCLVGDPAPRVAAEYERSSHPVAGDLVLEISWRRPWMEGGGSPGPSLGILVEAIQEPCMSREELAEMHKAGDCWTALDESYESIPTELIWYVQPLDESCPLARWHDASFIRVHTEFPE